MPSPAALDRRPLLAAATLLGVGMGGFVDGIVFHQLLQTHHMLSAPGYFPKAGVPRSSRCGTSR